MNYFATYAEFHDAQVAAVESMVRRQTDYINRRDPAPDLEAGTITDTQLALEVCTRSAPSTSVTIGLQKIQDMKDYARTYPDRELLIVTERFRCDTWPWIERESLSKQTEFREAWRFIDDGPGPEQAKYDRGVLRYNFNAELITFLLEGGRLS